MKLFIALLLLIISQAVSAEERVKTVVVVAKNSQIENLTNQHIANIFLARTKRFPNGVKALPIELKNSKVRDVFYQNISGKSPKQLYAYWATLVFTGKGKPPRSYANSAELQTKLLDNLGSITYLPVDQVTDQMKIVYRFP